MSNGSESGLDLAANPFAELKPVPSTPWDEWTLAAEVRRAQRVLTSTHSRIDAPIVSRKDEPQAVLQAHGSLGDRGDRPATAPFALGDAQEYRRVCVTAVTSSLIALGCGLALVIRANASGGGLNSHLGLPLMLLGVFGLLLGLLVQMLWLRRDSRAAVDRMRLIELRLQEYRSTSLLLGGRKKSGAMGGRLRQAA